MSEFTQSRLKKDDESVSLRYFLEAREFATGESLEPVEPCERPDFICETQDGTQIGVELAKVRRGHPESILWDRILNKQEYMDRDHALELVQTILVEKDRKRRQEDWACPERTILVLELTDIPLWEMTGRLNHDVLPDLGETGFLEVWLADYTGLEAYDDVELFCLAPSEWWGYHPRTAQKPYG